MCKCGCNTCETKSTLMLNESLAPRAILSEGLKYHMDANKPLTEHLYRAGSDSYFNLWAEARSLYSREILEITHEDDLAVLTETNLGHFGMFEGKKVPLDFPIEITEYQGEGTNKISDDKLMRLIPKMPKGYVGKNTGIGKYTISTPDGEDIVLTQSKDKKNWSYEPSNVALKILNEQMDIYDDIANSEFGMDYDQLGSNEKEWVRDEIDNMEMRESLNESDSNYPDFDLNKNIRYQEGSISSGMWRYTGQEQGGKGVYRNLNNGQILAFDRSDFDIFRKHLSSHFDFSESLNENKAIITFKNDYEVKMNTGEGYDDDFEYFKAGEREQVYILDKNDKRTHVEFGDGTNAFIPSDVISVQEKSLNEVSDENFVKGIELLRSTLSKEGGAAGLEPLVKALSGLGFSKDEVVDLIKNNINIKQHRDGDYILLPLEEAKKKAKKNTKKLNKPMRDSSGGKAYKVYVKDPKTKKIKTVRFGSGGLRAKINDKKARNAFAKRHNCSAKKDKTKAGYWSCRLPRYAKLLGLKSNFGGFW